MQVYAGMIDRCDQNIGRLLTKIKELSDENNTSAERVFYPHSMDANYRTESRPFTLNPHAAEPCGRDNWKIVAMTLPRTKEKNGTDLK